VLSGLRVLERGSHAAFAGRLLVACGATVGVERGKDGIPIVRPWCDQGKTEFRDFPPDLILDGRVAGAARDDAWPGVATARVTPFGEDGPWAGWRGSELVHQALSGFMALDGYDGPDEPPVMAAGGQAEIVGGLMGAIAALLVLNGAGQRAATSWHEALSVGHETEFAAWTARGERLLRHTGQHAAVEEDPRRWQWRAADGRYVNLILPALTTQRWASIVDWLSSKGMAADLADERFLKGRARLAEERHIYDVLGAFVGSITADEAFEGGQARDLPWGVVRRPEENLADPQFQGRPVFETGAPWRVTEGPVPPASWVRRPGPVPSLRVLDLTWQVAGPTITRILAHAGADVVKVERPGKPELMRVMPVGSSAIFDGEGSPFFANLNAGKRSLGLDLADRSTLLQLVAAADVVVENFSSRVMDKLGLSFDDLAAANPSVVYLSLSGFGHEGPRRDYDTWGPTAQAISGCTWLSGLPGREPAGYGWSYLDYVAGYFATAGLLSALWATRRDGRARWVDVSQVECGLVCATDAWLAPGSVQVGNDGPVVRAGDGRWVAGLERAEVGADAYAAVLAAQAEGRAAAVVQDVADRLQFDEQLRHLGTYPVLDGVPFEATPIRIDGRSLPLRHPAPRLGEHTEEVLAQWLFRSCVSQS
jgi:crotonobetainyl-CoA:carnitine CoA-transferase CaiB-like acyl-CoA transferase